MKFEPANIGDVAARAPSGLVRSERKRSPVGDAAEKATNGRTTTKTSAFSHTRSRAHAAAASTATATED
ncbi:MAG: hypothetical protein A4S14_05480 [Proteobacteria bacterium SG_bin9]|nr:MAG: hypothetical protein A4S14_05480 [Proteobacteria bacterium SG_bin9]